MHLRDFLKAGHTPSLACALLYFDVSFMVWVLLGALANSVVPEFGLNEAQRGLMLAVPLLGGDGWESDRLFELAGNALEGAYYSSHYAEDNPAPELQRFITAFRARYGRSPEAASALGYDAAKVALAAMARAESLSGPVLRDAIASTKDFPGATGSLTLDASRNPVKPAVILTQRDGSAPPAVRGARQRASDKESAKGPAARERRVKHGSRFGAASSWWKGCQATGSAPCTRGRPSGSPGDYVHRGAGGSGEYKTEIIQG